ncbi:alpha/beta hydrolase, partial [Microbacterium sp. 2FI]|uniref:alpha/beta fold hydrolase n=1 Tax=Microbacterium sp. 2FI TaxID=2502193 RepID=UPI001BB1EDAB
PSPSPSPTSSGPAVVSGPSWDGPVEVAEGRQLNATCTGEGSPAVIYLHGMIQPSDEVAWAHSPEMERRLSEETTYCEYERANVGASSPQDGPIHVSESVDDLNALIEQVGLEPPVILLGGSFGGLIAYTYAATHPDDVAGVVLLDPTLPDELALDAMLPPEWRLTEDSWRDSAEKIDPVGALMHAQSAVANIPPIPGTIFVTDELWAPEGDIAETFKRTVRDQQQALIERFQPGETITVDAPHAMIPVVPDEIAAAVIAQIEAAR